MRGGRKEREGTSASGINFVIFLLTNLRLTTESSTIRIHGAFNERGLHIKDSNGEEEG